MEGSTTSGGVKTGEKVREYLKSVRLDVRHGTYR